MRNAPIVKLYPRNPWEKTLSSDVLLQILLTAAIDADQQLVRMIEANKVEPGRESFGMVMLDPTRPRGSLSFADRLMAVVEIGPHGDKYAINGAAKADAHDRHGMPTSAIVSDVPHLLGDADFAWGGSVEYKRAIAGGSGLSVEQDADMALGVLKHVIKGVNSSRNLWLKEQRALSHDGNHRWFNPEDEPGDVYVRALQNQSYMTPLAA
jgi:hypothetical protein